MHAAAFDCFQSAYNIHNSLEITEHFEFFCFCFLCLKLSVNILFYVWVRILILPYSVVFSLYISSTAHEMSHCLFFYGVRQLEMLIFFLINSFFKKDNFNVYNNKPRKWTELCLISGPGKWLLNNRYKKEAKVETDLGRSLTGHLNFRLTA